MTAEQKERCIGRLFKMVYRKKSRHGDLRDEMNLYEMLLEANQIRPLSLPFDELRAGFVRHYNHAVAERLRRESTEQLSLFEDVGVRELEVEVAEREIELPSMEEAAPQQKANAVPRPPIDAEFILHLFLKREEQDAVIGDLLERYVKKHKRLGKNRADIWFYLEVGRSLWPLAKRSAAKAVRIAIVGEWIRRMIH